MKSAARLQSKPESGRASGQQGAFFSGPAPVQAKLNVSRPGDRYERQADQAADAAVHGRGPLVRGGRIAAQMTPLVQRAREDEAARSVHDRASDPLYDEHEPILRPDCPTVEDEPVQMVTDEEAQTMAEDEAQAKEEEEAQTTPEAEEKAQRAPEETLQADQEEAQMASEEEAQTEIEAAQPTAEEAVQMRAIHPRPSARAKQLAVVERQLKASRGRGNPLPEPTRRKMEAAFGAALSGIRIHTDTPAALMTRLLNAKAFASGRDIFFSPQRFAPGTARGDHLIAHELAHTLQQGGIEISDNAPAQTMPEGDKVASRPESLRAIGFARQHIGKINTKMTDAEGNRVGWKRLLEIFRGAFDGDVINPLLIKKPIMKDPHGLPHWCGIFAWSNLRKAGLALPPWQLGKSIVPYVGVRSPGELPHKGDIAYRKKWPGLKGDTHHQALVTGVESIETAAEKPFESIMIRTVDGNTAGNDNLGGQVEEKWLPARLWDYFFVPTAKLSLPDVPLIVTDRAAEEIGGLGPESESVESQEEVTGEGAVKAAPEVAEELPPPIPDDVLAPPSEAVPVDLPPPPDASVEPPAQVEALSLEGPSDKALTTFIDASPSAMAKTAPSVGTKISAKADAEKTKAADDAPVLEARTGGELNPQITAPGDIPTPEDTTLNAEGKGPETGDLKADPYQEKGTAPSTRTMRDEVKKKPEGGFLDWIKNQFNSLMAGIRVTDSSINVSAGKRQRVALTGDADLGQMGRQRTEGTEKLRGERDKVAGEFRNHPGQSNIQPRKIDEKKTAPISKDPAEPIEDLPPDEGAADYVDAELPKQVRDAADAKIAPDLHTNLADARSEATGAAAKRDADRDAAIADAEAKATKTNVAADDRQRQAVVAGRGDVARSQGEAVGQAYDGVAKFATDVGKRETDDAKKIRDNVKLEEGKADKELEKGEEKAREHKKNEEAKAAAKKAELKKKKEKGGLLSRAASFIKDAINKITEAIDAIFEGLRKLVKTAINAAKDLAIGLINAARKVAIGALEGFRSFATGLVSATVGAYFPGVAKAMNDKINSAVDTAVDGVNAAADGAIAGVKAAANWLGKKMDNILDKFKAGLKGAIRMAGALMTGDFAGAARIAIETTCKIAGIDPQPIFDFIDRAASQIKAILKAPGKFINNVMTAIGMGVRGFAERFGQHFKTGAIKWLTGALSAVPITLPDKWDLKGIFSLVAQILGLTYGNIKSRIIKKYPKAAKIFDLVEAGFALIKKLINKDFSGLWEEVKTKLSDLKQTVIDGVKNWAITNVIKEGIIWLLSLLNPASALVKALKLLADLVFWLIDNFQRIKEFVMSVYTAITNIAAGVLAPAAKAVEDAMARSLPVVISFVASAIGLGNIGEAVQKIIAKITAPINKMIDALIDRVVAFAKKLWGKMKKGGKKLKDKLIKWWSEKKPFTSKDGAQHKLYYKGSGKRAVLWVNSTPQKLEAFLKKKKAKGSDEEKGKAAKALEAYTKVFATENKLDKKQGQKPGKSDAEKKKRRKEIKSLVLELRNDLEVLATHLNQISFTDKVAVPTVIDNSDGSPKTVTANPLSYIPGKEKGSSPFQDPPGWSHAAKLNQSQINAGKSKTGDWVRGHLLNDNLHGPGKAWNLVPIRRTTNAQMESAAEGPAKAALKKKEDILHYHAKASFNGTTVPGFPTNISIAWGILEKKGDNYTPKTTTKKPFSIAPPPATVTVEPPSIKDGNVSQLAREIGGVTTYFVRTWLAGNNFSSGDSMVSQLYTNVKADLVALGGDVEPKRKKHVDVTYEALKQGHIRL
jgi:hypothetical protein